MARSVSHVGRQPCPSNLRQIGQALLLHSKDHDGVYPLTFDALAASQQLTDEVFACYYTRKAFVFLTPGARADALTEDDPVAYEPPEYHDGEGSNVLFGDGHVSWLSTGGMKLLLARAATRLAATMPATTP